MAQPKTWESLRTHIHSAIGVTLALVLKKKKKFILWYHRPSTLGSVSVPVLFLGSQSEGSPTDT